MAGGARPRSTQAMAGHALASGVAAPLPQAVAAFWGQ